MTEELKELKERFRKQRNMAFETSSNFEEGTNQWHYFEGKADGFIDAERMVDELLEASENVRDSDDDRDDDQLVTDGGKSLDGTERTCEYCESREAIEWSDQGRAQCEVCSP